MLAVQIEEWREVDRQLRTIAQRRAALDAEEARWLRKAEALQLWRELGMVSALDYLERVLGYAPRTSQQRMSVARALPRINCLVARFEARLHLLPPWCTAARGPDYFIPHLWVDYQRPHPLRC